MKKSLSSIFTAWLVLICFSTSTIAQAAPLISEPSAYSPTQQSPAWNLEIPSQWGNEVESFGKQATAPIFYIQDAHCDYRAQKSIAALIESLAAEYRAFHPAAKVRIALEGASSSLNIQPFREFSKREAGRQVNDFYMRKGLLSGAEFAALNLGERALLQGVETQAVYRRNLASYRAASGAADQAVKLISKLSENLDKEKNGLFSPELKLVDETEKQFYGRKLGLLEYLAFLIQHAASGQETKEPWEKRYPHLAKLEDIRRTEESIDFARLQNEIEKILSALTTHSAGLSAKRLAAWVEARNTGDYAGFFGKLIKDVSRIKLDLAGYPEVNRYAGYRRLFDEMEGPQVFRELEAWTAEIKVSLYRSEEEREKDQYGVILRYADKVARLEATRQELEVCENAVRDKKISADIDVKLAPALAFYADAKTRDRVLFENLRALLSADRPESKEPTLTFFVTGGFHSDALAGLLRGKGISYRMLAPRFEQGEGDSPYAQLMRGRTSPLRQVAGAFQYDSVKALAQENLSKIDVGAGRELFYKFRFNTGLLKAGPGKIKDRELIETEFSAVPFAVKNGPSVSPEPSFDMTLQDAIRRKDFGSFKTLFTQALVAKPVEAEEKRLCEFLNETLLKQAFEALASGRADAEPFVQAIGAAEKKALLSLYREKEEASFSTRIQALEGRKEKFLKTISEGKTSAEEVASRLVATRGRTELAQADRPGLPEQAATRGRTELALEAFLEEPENRFELLIAHHKAQQALGYVPREAVEAEAEGPEMQVLAASLGTGEDPLAFQDLVDTLREKFEVYFRDSRASGYGPGFLAESDFLEYAYAMVSVRSLDEVLAAFGQMRTVFSAEKDFAQNAGLMFLAGTDAELDASVYDLKIKLLDETAADIAIRTAKGRAIRKFESANFDPAALDESQPAVYARGVERLVEILKAYQEIAALPNWAYHYNDERNRSILEPAIASAIKTDMIGNLLNVQGGVEQTLRRFWGKTKREDRSELLGIVEFRHWAYQVVNRLARELPAGAFPVMRQALEKIGTAEARELLTYIAPPTGEGWPVAESLGVAELENLEAAYRDLYKGKIVKSFTFIRDNPGWKTADGVFYPSTLNEIQGVLSMAGLKAGQKLLDLGSGDGRVVIAAAYLFGAEADGYETDPKLAEAGQAMRSHLTTRPETRDGFDASKARIHQESFLSDSVDWSRYDVIYYYDLGSDFDAEKTHQLFKKIQTMKPGALFIIHHSITFDVDLFPFLEHVEALQLTERSRPTQIYRKPDIQIVGLSLGTLDDGQRKGLELGIDPRHVAPGMRFDEMGEGYSAAHSRDEKIQWWLKNHELGNKLTNRGVREMAAQNEFRLRDEFRTYFTGKVPDETDDRWYSAHQILHDVFLTSLTDDQRREFFHLVKTVYEDYTAPGSAFTGLTGRPSLLYFLVDGKILDASKQDPLRTFEGLIYLSEVFARMGGLYIGLPYPPDSPSSYDYHENIFHPFFEQIGLHAASYSVQEAKAGAVQRFQPMDFTPDLLDETRPEVYAEGVRRLTELLQAYRGIASRPNWAYRYNEQITRSMLDPDIARDIRTDMIPNLITAEQASEKTLSSLWPRLAREDREQLLEAIEYSHWALLVVRRLFLEIPKEDFLKIREALEKSGKDEDGTLRSYIATPAGSQDGASLGQPEQAAVGGPEAQPQAASLGTEGFVRQGPQAFWDVVQKWNERYGQEGKSLAFQQQEINVLGGIGSILEFDTLKQALNALAGGQHAGLSAKDWIESPDEYQTILSHLRDSGIISDHDRAALDAAFQFLDSIVSLYLKNQLTGPVRQETMETFLNILARQRGEAPISRENIDDAMAKFYKEFYGHAETAFEIVTRAIPALYQRRYAAGPDLVEALDDNFVITRRQGLYFDLKEGFKEGEIREINFARGENPNLFLSRHPEHFFRVFEHAAAYQLPVGPEVAAAINRNLGLFEQFLERERNAPDSAALEEVNGSFRNIFRSPRDISAVIWQMHHLGILDVYIPHYSRIRNLFTEFVHRFSVDMHTVYNMELMEQMAATTDPAFSLASEAYKKIRLNADQIMILRFALLFHDIGKGLYSPFGPGHAVTGAQDIVPPALQQIGLRRNQIRQVAWLVRYHMALNAAADRIKDHPEDLYQKTMEFMADPGINQFLLNGLFVISFADKFGVDPGRNEFLLRQGNNSPLAALDTLYMAGSRILGQPAGDRRQMLAELVAQIREKDEAFSGELAARLTEAMSGDSVNRLMTAYLESVDSDELKTGPIREEIMLGFAPENFSVLLETYLNLVPVNYIKTLESQPLLQRLIFLRHIEVLKNRGIKTALVMFDPFHYQYENFVEVIVGLTHDEPGLVAKLTGALAANGIDVNGAEVNTSGQGVGMDRFFGFLTEPAADLKALESTVGYDMRLLLSGGATAHHLFDIKGKMYGSRKKISGVLDRHPRIRFEENAELEGLPVSVLNLETIDRVGLLHLITDLFARNGINVVKISAATYNHLAKDVFFINKNGRPLNLEERSEIARTLFDLLRRDIVYEGGPEASSLGQPEQAAVGGPVTQPQASSLGTESPAGHVERWAYLGNGQAMLEAAAVERAPFDAALLEPALAALDKKIKALGRWKQKEKTLAGKVLAHLRDLASAGQIYGFDELRWADDDYLAQFVSSADISLGRGFFDPGAFKPEELAHLLFYAGLKNLALREQADFLRFEDDQEISGLENTVFPRSKLWTRLNQFITLDDSVLFNAALDRFNAFEQGSPYFGTVNLFDKWLAADMQGRELPVLRQAGYLMRVFLESSIGQKILTGDYQSVEYLPAKEKEPALKVYVKVLLPLYAFSVFRGEFLDSAERLRSDLTRGLVEEARAKRIPQSSVNFHESIVAYLRQADPFAPSVALLVSMTGPFPAEGFTLEDLTRTAKQYNELARRVIFNKAWLDKKWEEIQQHKEPPADPDEFIRDTEVPEAGWTSLDHLAFHFAFLTQQSWNGWQHVVNRGFDETMGFGLHLSADVQENAVVRAVTLDAVPKGSMFLPRSFVQQSHKRGTDTVIIQRSRQVMVRDLLHWFKKEYDSTLTKQPEFQAFLSALLKTRRNITPATIDERQPHAVYSLQGVDPMPWSASVLRLAALNDLAFWPMVKAYYGSLAPFLDFAETRTLPEDDITLFWYYGMFTHPRGIFAWLAGRHPEHRTPLQYVGNTARLTDESARDLLDAIMGIVWSGPMGGIDVTHRKAALIDKLLDFVRLTPNAVYITDPEAFERFLTQDLTEEALSRPSMGRFEAWRAQRFPEVFPENQSIGHVILAKEPASGEAQVLTANQPSYYYPFMIEPENLLFPDKWRWNNSHEPSLAVYIAEYQDGIVVPAPADRVSFKYVIQGIPNGTPLRVAVFPDGNVLIQKAYDQSGEDVPAYVKIPLAQAQGGVIAPQRTWQRIPVVAPGQHADRFYHARAQDDGLLILRLGEHVISVNAPASGGKDLLVQIHEGALLVYDTAQPAYLGKVSFNGRVVIEAPNGGLSLLPELPESVRDNHFQTGREHAALRGLAQSLKDVMKMGLGYKKIVISDEAGIRLEGDKILLPRTYLENPQQVSADVEKHLSSHDLLRKLETHVAELNRLEKSQDIFDGNVPIPDNLSPVSPAALAAWAEPARRDYARLMTAMETVHKRLVVIRTIGSHRQELGTMASAERLRRTLSQLLQQQTPQDFFFLNRSGGSTIHGIRGMRSAQGGYQDYEGVGYTTDQFYTLDADHDLVLGERSRSSESEDESRRKIFVRFKKGGKQEGKLVLLLFDAETGQLFDEEKNQLSTRMEQLYGAVPLLNSEPGLKDELQKALAGTESVAQQIQVLDYFRQFLPRLLASEHAPVNAAMLRMVFTAVARGGLAQAQRLNALLTASARALPNLMEEFEILLLFFDLHPSEEKNQQDAGYPARFAEFVSGVLIPLVQSPRKEAPDFSDPAFFEEMTDYLTGIQHQVQALWDVGSIRRDGDAYKWDGLMAQRFSLAERETDEPNSIHQYFMKLGPGSETPVEIETEAITPEEQTMSRAERRQRATHLTFLGGADGIGASSMEVAYQGMETPGWARILVDAGAQLDEYNTPPAFRFLKDTPNAVFLTHSHIDHVGSAVFLYRRLGKKVPFFATRDTVDLLRITLHAMVRDINRKIEEYNYFAHTFFTAAEVEEFLANIQAVEPVSREEDGTPIYPVLAVSPKMKVQFHHAGHLHGAASLIVMTPDGNTFISGDISKRAQGPVPGFRDWGIGMPPIHTAVVESTYGMAERESEEEQEMKLVQNIVKVLKRGGKVLLPAYANGRAPRLLDVILRRMNEFPPDMQKKLKIFVDGIASSFTEAYQSVYPSLRDNRIELIGNKFESAREGYEYREERILGKSEPAIIIASSANLQGMSAWYGRKLAEDPRNGIFFTGYMDPLEPASALMDIKDGGTFRFREGDDPVAVRAERNSFKLSGHASGKEILEILGALDRAGNLGISFMMYEIFLMFVKLGFSLPGAGSVFVTQMIRKLTEGSLKRVIFVHGSAKARSEIIGGVKTIEKHEEWHPIDSRVGQSVIGVADPENKTWFDQVAAVSVPTYTAASLGTEEASQIYRLLGNGRVINLSPYFVGAFLGLAGSVPVIRGMGQGVAGLYRKAQEKIQKYGMFFIHGNLVLDKQTGKAILFAGDRDLGKSVVAAGLVHDPSGRFEIISDNNVLAMMEGDKLFAGPASYLNPKRSMPPFYRDRKGNIIRYASPIHANYRFFPVESVVHFTRNDMAAFSKVSEGIELESLFQSLTVQIDEFVTPPDHAADVLQVVGQGSVRAITVGIPADEDRRNYEAVTGTVKQMLAQSLGGEREAGAARVQEYLNDIFGQPGEPWIYAGRWENYKIISTPWYYRVGSMFYLPYADQEFQTRLFDFADNLANAGVRRYYADEAAYRGLLGELAPYRDNWVVARLRQGNLTPYLGFASGFFTLSTILGLMEDRNVIAGQRVLIAGSAGGIQSVTAARLGAEYVLGIDKDRALIDMADKLADWNGVDREKVGYEAIDFKNASEEALGRFDYLAANLPEWGLYSEGQGTDEKWLNWHQLLVERFPNLPYYLAAGETIGHPVSGWVEHILKSAFRDVSIAVRIQAARSDYIAWRGADRKIEGQSLGASPFVPLIGVNVHRQDTQTTENVEQIQALYRFLSYKGWLHQRQIDVKEQAVSRLVEAVTAELANYSEHFLRFFMEGGKLQVCCTEILVGMFDFAAKNPEKRMEIHLPLEFIYYPDAMFKVFDSPVEEKAGYVMNNVKSAMESRGLSYRIYDNNRIAAENHPGRAKADVQVVIRMWSKTDGMLSTFEREATASSLGQEAAPERSVRGLLDALRDLSSEIENAAAKIPADAPVLLMITGQSGTYKTQLAKLLKAGIAGIAPGDIDIIGTDDLTEGEFTKRERFWQLTPEIETDLFWDFLVRKRPDGRPFKLKIVEGFHGPDFFAQAGFSPHVDMVVTSPAKMRILTDILRYGVLGPVNFLYMLTQDSLAEFKDYQGPRFSRIRFDSNMEWPWVKWKMSWQHNGGKRTFDAAAVSRAARHEKLPETLLAKFLEPHWTDHLFRTVYTLKMPKPESVTDLDSVSETEAQSLGEVARLFDPAAESGLSGVDIGKLAGLIERADRVWGHARLMERIEKETAAYIKKLTEEHRVALAGKIKAMEAELEAMVAEKDLRGAFDEKAAKLLAGYFLAIAELLDRINATEARPRLSLETKAPLAKTFLKRVFPADAKLAVIFSVSDARGAYSLESASYRNAVRSVLESNPLAVIRIAHTDSSPERVQSFQREFAEFGPRLQIETAERAHIPYVLNGFLNDGLLNQVKSLSGKSSLKKTELTRYISVVADSDVLDQFRKIALGGKELVSMVRSKLLESKDAALTEGAVLFEWGMAHFVAFSEADEIRREVSEDELAIHGNRYIPNEAGLTGLLAALGEAWQGIQATLRAA